MNPELEEPESFDSPLVQSSPSSMPQATTPVQSVSEPISDSIADEEKMKSRPAWYVADGSWEEKI